MIEYDGKLIYQFAEAVYEQAQDAGVAPNDIELHPVLDLRFR